MATRGRSKRAKRQPLPDQYVFLAEHMADAGIGDQELADKIGADRVTVTRYRSHQSRINLPKLDQIARALGRKPEALFAPPAPPTRPSLDARLTEAPDTLVQRASAMLDLLLETKE